jgi:hypothetical protein
MFSFKRPLFINNTEHLLPKSRLYDQLSFYQKFGLDLAEAKEQVIIESPFITVKRLSVLLPILRDLADKHVAIIINTRDPREHEGLLRSQAETGVMLLQQLGAQVLYTGGHHRKIAIIDSKVLWEGSLNILSQNDSCEIMRRSDSKELCQQMISFVGAMKWER